MKSNHQLTKFLDSSVAHVVVMIGKGFERVALVYRVATERRTLSRLTDRELMDIGIDRHGALHECGRAWFDIPSNRMPFSGLRQRDSQHGNNQQVVLPSQSHIFY